MRKKWGWGIICLHKAPWRPDRGASQLQRWWYGPITLEVSSPSFLCDRNGALFFSKTKIWKWEWAYTLQMTQTIFLVERVWSASLLPPNTWVEGHSTMTASVTCCMGVSFVMWEIFFFEENFEIINQNGRVRYFLQQMFWNEQFCSVLALGSLPRLAPVPIWFSNVMKWTKELCKHDPAWAAPHGMSCHFRRSQWTLEMERILESLIWWQKNEDHKGGAFLLALVCPATWCQLPAGNENWGRGDRTWLSSWRTEAVLSSST